MFLGRIAAVPDEDIMDAGSSHTQGTAHSSHSSDLMRGEPTYDGLRFPVSSLSEEPPPQLNSDTVQNMMHPNPNAGFMYMGYDDDNKKLAAKQRHNMLSSVKEVDGDPFTQQQLSLRQVTQAQHDELLFGIGARRPGMTSSLVGKTVSAQAGVNGNTQGSQSMIDLSGLSDQQLQSLSTSIGRQHDPFAPDPLASDVNVNESGPQMNPLWGLGMGQQAMNGQHAMIGASHSMPNIGLGGDFSGNQLARASLQQANSFHGFPPAHLGMQSPPIGMQQMMPNLAFPVENVMGSQQPINSLHYENQLKIRQQMMLQQPMQLQANNQMPVMNAGGNNFGMPFETMTLGNMPTGFQQEQEEDMGPLSDLEDDGNGGSSSEPRKPRQRRTKSFPEKLLEALSKFSSEETATWLPDGKSFVIVNDDLFVDRILSKEFKASKYSSFVRKLHRWGFVRLISGTGTDCFHHPMFQRGREDLVAQISSSPRCQKPSRKKLQQKRPSFTKSPSTGTELSGSEDQSRFVGLGTGYNMPSVPYGGHDMLEPDPLPPDSLPTDTLASSGGADLPDDVVSEDVWDDDDDM